MNAVNPANVPGSGKTVSVKITALMASPIAMEGMPPFLPLDGLLARAYLRRKLGPEFFAAPPPSNRYDGFITPDLPLVKWNAGADDWFWAASGAQFDAPLASTEHWNKRVREGEMAKRTTVGQIQIGKGQFKAYHQPLPVMHVRELVWYACCPSPEAYQNLLELMWYVQIDGVGKKAATGHGKVRKLRFSLLERDESVWAGDGSLRRAVPMSWLAREKPQSTGPWPLRHMAVQPPYFLPPLVACAVPSIERAGASTP